MRFDVRVLPNAEFVCLQAPIPLPLQVRLLQSRFSRIIDSLRLPPSSDVREQAFSSSQCYEVWSWSMPLARRSASA